MLLIKNAVFICLLTSIWISPVYAGLFGPSNYEECVLENMKGIQSNTAAGAVMQACRKKFPVAPAPTSESASIYLFSMLNKSSTPELVAAITKLSITKTQVDHYGKDYGYGVKDSWFEYYQKVYITNRNDFPVSAISIGLVKAGKKCTADTNDYTEFYDCTGTVSSMGSGSFNCPIPNVEKRNISYCITGIGVYLYPSGASKFAKDYSFPKPN